MDVHGTEVWRETRTVYVERANGDDRETSRREALSCPSTRWNCPQATSTCACSGHGTCTQEIGPCRCEPDWYGIDCSHGIMVRNRNKKPQSTRTSHRLSWCKQHLFQRSASFNGQPVVASRTCWRLERYSMPGAWALTLAPRALRHPIDIYLLSRLELDQAAGRDAHFQKCQR
jgi:hypothetical protein